MSFAIFRNVYLGCFCLIIAPGLSSASAPAQANKAIHVDTSRTDSGKEDFRFEVVSIRPLSKPMAEPRPGLTPDGFNTQLSVRDMIMWAYASEEWPAWLTGNGATRIGGNPPQLIGDYYEINARVADTDREAWRNQGNRHELLDSALRDVLKVRFKLVIRQQSAEVPGLLLVRMGKGVKVKAPPPGFALPTKGRPLRSGGVAVGEGYRWHYYGATMEDLAAFLSLTTQRPVEDSTGLIGRYEFTIQRIELPSNETDELPNNWPISQLGLSLKPGKVPGRMLIIDHIEKPTANLNWVLSKRIVRMSQGEVFGDLGVGGDLPGLHLAFRSGDTMDAPSGPKRKQKAAAPLLHKTAQGEIYC